MKLSLSSLKVHLSWCSTAPAVGRAIGLIFTPTGIPKVANVPTFH